MKRFLPFILLIGFFNIINAQTGNQINGAAITPNQSNPNTPFPYDGTTTFTPGSLLTTGDWNLAIGPGAGASLGISYRNVLIGGLAGAKLNESIAGVDAEDNVVIGMFAADLTQSASDNVFIGNYVARNATGNDNVVVGHRAGQNLIGGFDNTLIGEEAGKDLTEGNDNVFIGEDAGSSTTTGSNNTFVGSATGLSNTTGSGNTFVGGGSPSAVENAIAGFNTVYSLISTNDSPGEDNRTGQGNTFIGGGAGQDNSDGYANTFLGFDAGANSQHADGNTFIGYGAGWDNNRTNDRNKANRNTYVGAMAGGTNREGSDNVGMGWNANFTDWGTFGPGAGKNNRNTFIGNAVDVFGDDQVIMGYQARATGNRGSITIGSLSSTANSYSAAIGYNVDVTEANTMALGGNTTTNRMSVGIGTVAANQNASLELADTDKGFLVNRVTTAQRTAMETAAASGNPLAAAEAGMIVYDTDLSAIFVWNGTAWVNSTIDNDIDTDDQIIDVFQLTDNDLELSIQDDAEATKIVDLSKYLDNTDSQELSLAINMLSISGGTTTVDLSGYLDNTDRQNLTSATLVDSQLTIAIQNGNSVSVDLSAILTPLRDENTAQQNEIDEQQAQITAQQIIIEDLINRIEALENNVVGQINKSNIPILYQTFQTHLMIHLQ